MVAHGQVGQHSSCTLKAVVRFAANSAYLEGSITFSNTA
jgi:hypothetical protein